MDTEPVSHKNNGPHEIDLRSDSFVECPQIFLAQLTPEQFRARLQLYQTAYERAAQQAEFRRRSCRKPQALPDGFVPPFEFDFGQGI